MTQEFVSQQELPLFPERYAGVKYLWEKVILRAINDYVLWKNVRDLRHRRDARDAARWLFEDSSLSNSLDNVCLLVGVRVESVRQFAQAATKKDVKKFEHIDREDRTIRFNDQLKKMDPFVEPVPTRKPGRPHGRAR